MAIYRNYKQLFTIIGNGIRSNTLKTIDEFLNENVGNKANNAGLILEYIKSNGVSGDTTIRSLISTNANFGLLNDALRLAGTLNRTDLYTKTFNDSAIYTSENKTILKENDLSAFGYTGGTVSFTNLTKKGDDIYVDFGGGLYGETYRLTGSVNLIGDDSIYFIPLGLIEMGPNSYVEVSFGQNNCSVNARDLGGDILLTNPMIQGCYLSDGFGVVPTSFAEINLVPGSFFGLGDDDYFIGLVIGEGFVLDPLFGDVIIDQKIVITRTKEQLGVNGPKFSNIVSDELFVGPSV